MDYNDHEGYVSDDNNIYQSDDKIKQDYDYHDDESEPSLYSDSITVNSKLHQAYNRNRKKIMDSHKQNDPGYFKFKRTILSSDLTTKRKSTIEGFRTNNVGGTMIRDAITGFRYANYRVGTAAEDLFFKERRASISAWAQPAA